jgi:hypothetical protein
MKDRQDMGTILHKDFKTNCKEKNYEEIRKNAFLLLSFKKNVNTGGEREREREREREAKQI